MTLRQVRTVLCDLHPMDYCPVCYSFLEIIKHDRFSGVGRSKAKLAIFEEDGWLHF